MNFRPLRLEHMWNIETAWFDVAIIMSMFAVGNILFGHFEEHKPKWRRLLKVAIFLAMTLVLSYLRLRWMIYTFISAVLIVVAYLHLRWLPSHGINGWTGEPKEKYYELLGIHGRDHGNSAKT